MRLKRPNVLFGIANPQNFDLLIPHLQLCYLIILTVSLLWCLLIMNFISNAFHFRLIIVSFFSELLFFSHNFEVQCHNYDLTQTFIFLSMAEIGFCSLTLIKNKKHIFKIRSDVRTHYESFLVFRDQMVNC